MSAVTNLPTRISDAEHLTHLLDQAQGAVDREDSKLAILHLAQAAFVGATKGTNLSEFELLRRVRAIVDRGGRVA